MKIFSSSPYASFNPKELDSLSRINNKFSDTPIRITKRNIRSFKNIKSTKVVEENNDIPKQIELAFA